MNRTSHEVGRRAAKMEDGRFDFQVLGFGR